MSCAAMTTHEPLPAVVTVDWLNDRWAAAQAALVKQHWQEAVILVNYNMA